MRTTSQEARRNNIHYDLQWLCRHAFRAVPEVCKVQDSGRPQEQHETRTSNPLPKYSASHILGNHTEDVNACCNYEVFFVQPNPHFSVRITSTSMCHCLRRV